MPTPSSPQQPKPSKSKTALNEVEKEIDLSSSSSPPPPLPLPPPPSQTPSTSSLVLPPSSLSLLPEILQRQLKKHSSISITKTCEASQKPLPTTSKKGIAERRGGGGASSPVERMPITSSSSTKRPLSSKQSPNYIKEMAENLFQSPTFKRFVERLDRDESRKKRHVETKFAKHVEKERRPEAQVFVDLSSPSPSPSPPLSPPLPSTSPGQMPTPSSSQLPMLSEFLKEVEKERRPEAAIAIDLSSSPPSPLPPPPPPSLSPSTSSLLSPSLSSLPQKIQQESKKRPSIFITRTCGVIPRTKKGAGDRERRAAELPSPVAQMPISSSSSPAAPSKTQVSERGHEERRPETAAAETIGIDLPSPIPLPPPQSSTTATTTVADKEVKEEKEEEDDDGRRRHF